MFKFIALFFLLFAVSSVSFSQIFDSAKTVIIILNDDTEITGKITAKDSLNTTVRSISGVVSIIPNKQIAQIKKYKGGMIEGEYFKPDPASNRLMLFPTARPLKMGEYQFNAVELIFPHFIIGAADFLDIGFGGLPFLAGGSGTLIYYISAKIIPVNFSEGAVALGSAIIGSTEAQSIVGVMYGVGTFGTKYASVSFGPFFAFSKDEVFDRPAILLGGSARISKAATLISENIMLFGTETEDFIIFPSLGVRFSGERLAADFGTYAFISGEHFFYPIPWIGLTYKF